jgi:hypothetical protein
MQTTVELFDYVYDTSWGKMIYQIMADTSINIIVHEKTENYEKCAELHKYTIKKLEIYAEQHEHYHMSYDELLNLFIYTFKTLIEYNRSNTAVYPS